MTGPCAHVVDAAALPRPLALGTETLPAGTDLHHVGLVTYPFHSFDTRDVTSTQARFSPLVNTDGTTVPVFYAGETYEVAVAETLWHDADRSNPQIFLDACDNKTVGTVAIQRDLVLGQLLDPTLLRLHLTPDQVTQSEAECYERTTAFAQVVYHDQPELDGLVWMSRRFHGYRAYLIWQRDTAERLVSASSYDLVTTPAERSRLDDACHAAGIAIIPRII